MAMIRSFAIFRRSVWPSAWLCAIAGAGLMSLAAAQTGKGQLEFDRDVRPIISENCFKCHGPDSGARMAGLRLDTPEGATQKLASGKIPIVPGNEGQSELVARIAAKDSRQMPPPASGKKLTPAQIATLREWVRQ